MLRINFIIYEFVFSTAPSNLLSDVTARSFSSRQPAPCATVYCEHFSSSYCYITLYVAYHFACCTKKLL